MQADSREQRRIFDGKHCCQSGAGRHTGQIDTFGVETMPRDDLVHKGDDRRRFASAGIGGIFVPMPASVDVSGFRLLGVQHGESEAIGQKIDARTLREFFSRLLAAVHHHNQRHAREGCTGRQIQRVCQMIDEPARRRGCGVKRTAPLPRGPCRSAWPYPRLARNARFRASFWLRDCRFGHLGANRPRRSAHFWRSRRCDLGSYKAFQAS